MFILLTAGLINNRKVIKIHSLTCLSPLQSTEVYTCASRLTISTIGHVAYSSLQTVRREI